MVRAFSRTYEIRHHSTACYLLAHRAAYAGSTALDSVLRPDDQYLLAHWPEDGSRISSWGKHAKFAAFGAREFQQWHIIAAPGIPSCAM